LQGHGDACAGKLPGCLAAGETAADDMGGIVMGRDAAAVHDEQINKVPISRKREMH
jgi:hypothetical protein